MRRAAVLAVFLLAATTAVGVSPQEPTVDVGELAAALEITALPVLEDLASGCGAVVTFDGEDLCSPSSRGGSVAPTGASLSSGIDLQARSMVRTPRWYADLGAWNGDGLVRVHGYGDVATHGADMEPIWTRAGWSFFDDWGLDPFVVPIVLFGSSPLNPQAKVSERPFAVGDLTGDGVDDVAVGHYLVLFNEDSGNEISAHSVLSVLDGTTGATRWHLRHDGYLTQLVIADGVLLVANETGPKRSGSGAGADGTATSVAAYRFVDDAGSLTADRLWQRQHQAWTRVLAAEPVGAGRAALAVTDKDVGAAGDAGRIGPRRRHRRGAVGADDDRVPTRASARRGARRTGRAGVRRP